MKHLMLAITYVVCSSAVTQARSLTEIHERSERLSKGHLRVQDEIFSLVYDQGMDYDDQRIQRLRDRAEELLEEKEKLWASALAMETK